MFATLILEQEFARYEDLKFMALKWLLVMGLVSAVIIVGFLIRDGIRLLRGKKGFYLLEGFTGRLPGNDPVARTWRLRTFWLFHVIALGGGMMVLSGLRWVVNPQGQSRFEPQPWFAWGALIASFGCFAVLLWEFVLDLATLSPRRIWAIAQLSIKEAVRKKVLLSFLLILAVFLFASWFIKADRPQNQWRTYVNLVFFVMAALLLLTASVLACFSLPTDIRNQTIHTIVTKPVQKFEIILGRVLGYGLLMTVVLLVVSLASLFYVVRGFDERAEKDTMRARVFAKGTLKFEQNDPQTNQPVRLERGESVGREWDYRSYIRGGTNQKAIWRFENLPPSLKNQKQIPVEFSFDIYRMSKGGRIAEQGVQAQFSVRNLRNPRLNEYLQSEPQINPQTGLPYKPEEIARDFGYFQLKKPKVFDERNADTFEFPGELLQGTDDPILEIHVHCLSPGQYLGMANYDLFVRSSEGNFYLNYVKGTLGIWFVMMLVIGMGVVFSTYLSAMIAMLFTWVLMFCGLHRVRGFIRSLTASPESGMNPGGGPMEAAYRLFREENMTKQLERTRGVEALEWIDAVVRFLFDMLLKILPDLNQYDRTMFVAEGFNIPGADLVLNGIILVGYLFPFLLLGYYLLNTREVAGAA